MRKLFRIIIMMGFLLMLQTIGYAAPAVEGFAGVPWGTSREQSQKLMAEKGFTSLGQADGFSDKYKGVFAGHPAELKLTYTKDVFYCGEAIIKDMPAPEILWSMSDFFDDMKKLFVAKYGAANAEYTLGEGENLLGFGARWENLAAADNPAGQAYIDIRGIKKRPQSDFWGIIITYNIGLSWATFKADGGNI